MVLRMGAAALAVAITGVLIVLLLGPAPDADAAGVCPPITLDDFEPPEETSTTAVTSTTAEPDSSTTVGKTSTTESETTTTTGESTTSGPDTSTTEAETATSSTKKKTTTTAGTTTTTNAPCSPFVYGMTYPLAGTGRVISRLGDPRDGGERLHAGTDIAAETLTPVLAVSDGVVGSLHNERGSAEECCWATIHHDDGWTSYYIHLNNDTFGTDDGLGMGVLAGLEEGDRVAAGDVIGWVGDSGNAEDTEQPHLHFELRMPDGRPIDAAASLSAAGRSVDSGERDDAEHPYGDATLYLASLGVMWACDDAGIASCPDLPVEIDDLTAVAAVLAGANVERVAGTYGVDAMYGVDSPSEFMLKKVMGCDDRRCDPGGVTRAELARLATIVGRQLRSTEGLFGYTPGHRLDLPDRTSAVDYLSMTGRMGDCQLPLDDVEALSRGEAAYLFVSWAGIAEIEPCPDIIATVR